MESFEGFIIAFAVILLIIAVVSYALAYVIPIIIGIAVISFIINLISSINKEKRERLEKIEQERQFDEAQVRDEQKKQEGYYKEMIVLGDESITLFERLPNCLESAEKYLDQAEVKFSDSAFVPFWDSIEEAVKMLGYFNEGVQHIGKNSSHYTELIGKYEDTPPQFPLARQSVEKLDVGTATAERMKAIVGTAQRNFQFAMIYEQHKTNQILVAGFTNLANALDQMTWKITNSIDDLAGSVDVMTSTLNESLHAIHSRVGDIADIAEKTSQKTSQHHDELMEEISKGSARERKVLKMLDNIQRGRRPSL